MLNDFSFCIAGYVAETKAANCPLRRDEQGLANDSLLVSYDINDLRDREFAYQQSQELQRATLVALERKAIAHSLRDNFQLTGSDLPADTDPRQLHLF